MPNFSKMPNPQYDIPDTSLHLRQFEAHDKDNLLALATDDPVARFVPWAKFVKDEASAKQQIEEFNRSYSEGVRVRYAIIKDGVFAGYIGMWPDRLPNFYEFGFAMLPKFRGYGIGFTTAMNLIEHAKNDLGAAGMVAYVHDDNKASKATILKLGFQPSPDEFNKGDRRHTLVFVDNPHG